MLLQTRLLREERPEGGWVRGKLMHTQGTTLTSQARGFLRTPFPCSTILARTPEPGGCPAPSPQLHLRILVLGVPSPPPPFNPHFIYLL